jgi:hypothetical protein
MLVGLEILRLKKKVEKIGQVKVQIWSNMLGSFWSSKQ